MTKSAAEIADQAIARQEAEDAGIVTNDDKGGANGQAKDDSKGKPGAGEGGKPAGDAANDKPKYDADGKRIEAAAEDKPELDANGEPIEKKDEGEFTADDALETEAVPDKPAAPTDNAGIQLSPSEQKHIADNIGEPIVIRGYRGEGENAKEVEIKAYSPGDIPADFKFANDQQLVAAQTGFQKLEQRANELLGNYRQNQSQTAAQDFEQRENEGIKADLADLQKDGRFPKFKVQPGAAGFDDDPAAKQMQEVLNVMTERNDQYFKQYQQGRPYKHIGFAEAFDLWEAKNPGAQAAKAANKSQDDEDKERRANGAERAPTNNRGAGGLNIMAPRVKPGTTTRDILARIDNDDF